MGRMALQVDGIQANRGEMGSPLDEHGQCTDLLGKGLVAVEQLPDGFAATSMQGEIR